MSLRSKFVLVLTVFVLMTVTASTWLHIESTFEAHQEEMEARATALGRFIGLNFTDAFLKGDDRSEPTGTPIKLWPGEVDDAAGIVAVEPGDSTSTLLERADRALNDARLSGGTRLWLEE